MSLTLTLERGGGEVSGSGTNITLTGTMDGGAIESVELNGDTEQTTYSGKNLYEGSPSFNAFVGVSGWEDGGTYNGMPVVKRAGAWGGAYKLLNVEAGNTYTFSLWVKADQARQGSIYSSGSSTGATATITPNAKTLNISTDWERVSLTFECSVSGTVALRVENWTSSDTNYTYIAGYQLEVGSSMTSFEPYTAGASPNPDYPQEIQTVTGRQVVTISDGGSESQEYEINLGKNLLPFTNQNFTLKGVTFTVTDGTLYLDGTSQGETYANNQMFKDNFSFTLQPGTYILSRNNSHLATVQIKKFSDGTNIASTNGTYTTAIFTLTEPTKVVFGFYMYQNVFDNVNLELMLEKGSTATTYAPYFTPIELCKIGTYQDYIYKSGEDWYVHKEINKYIIDGTNGTYTRITTNRFNISGWPTSYKMERNANYSISDKYVTVQQYETDGMFNSGTANMKFALGFHPLGGVRIKDSNFDDVDLYKAWVSANPISAYAVLATPTDTQITNATLIAQLEALNAAQTYDGTTVITVSSENLAGSLEVTVSTNIAKTYTEVEIGSPFTITDVEGKSSNTTLDGNVYVDWAYSKKQYSFDLFNLTPQDYADIRAFYDYQFNNSAFPTITVPELNIDKLPVYMEISSRNIINQCLLTDKLTIKFRETVQP